MNIKHLLVLILALILTSCNIEEERKLSDTEVLELKKSHNDSIMLVLDSLDKINIYAPPLYDETSFDSAVVNSFFELAKQTKGDLKILVNAALITTEIKYIIEEYAVTGADILFLIDKTSSMQDDIANVQKGLPEIINTIGQYDNVRVAIGLYGDKNVDGKDWYSFKNFETNLESAKKFVKGIKVTGGMDYPESVYDGFFQASKENFWKSDKKRMVLLIGDAPPLEKPLSDYSLSDVISLATKDQITMNFYPIVVTPGFLFDGTVAKSYQKAKLVTSFYPNPSAGNLTINLVREGDYDLQIFDYNGVSILNEKHRGNKISKELYDLPNGVYLIRIVDSDQRFETIKIVLSK